MVMSPLGTVIDTHVHFQDPSQFQYTWLTPDRMGEARAKLPEAYERANEGINLEGYIFVEVAVADSQCVMEAEWVEMMSEEFPLLLGIIANAPVERGNRVEDVLDSLRTCSHVCGIRRLISAVNDPRECLTSDYIDGVRSVGRFGWVFELGTKDIIDLAVVAELVAACPEVQFVLEHLGRPNLAAGEMEPWLGDVARLAAFENVVCKVSRLLSGIGPGWTVERFRPYLESVMDLFGANRLMYGSDWPQHEEIGSVADQISVIDEIMAGASESEQDALYFKNALRVHGLTL
jgi:L-fuconolactonase